MIVGLLFGVLTDYLVFFVSGYRQRLREGAEPLAAVTAITAELLPVILTAELMIAGATLTLLISGVHLLASFGPAMAIAVIVAAAVSLTLVPAGLAIFGRVLLWPRGAGAKQGGRPAKDEGAGARGHLIGAAVRFPALTTILCVAILGVAASGVTQLALGNPVMRGLPPTDEVHQGYDIAATGLGPGVLGPTMVVVEGPGIGASSRRSKARCPNRKASTASSGRRPNPSRPAPASWSPPAAKPPGTSSSSTATPTAPMPRRLAPMQVTPLLRKLFAEYLGSAFLAATVIGSGIAAAELSGGNTGLQLFENAAATAAGLFTFILMFGPISGAHFNPVVSLVDASFGGLRWRHALAYIPAQVLGCISGALAANAMFALSAISISTTRRRISSPRLLPPLACSS